MFLFSYNMGNSEFSNFGIALPKEERSHYHIIAIGLQEAPRSSKARKRPASQRDSIDILNLDIDDENNIALNEKVCACIVIVIAVGSRKLL